MDEKESEDLIIEDEITSDDIVAVDMNQVVLLNHGEKNNSSLASQTITLDFSCDKVRLNPL